MIPREAVLAILEQIESASVEYLLVGAFAYIAYGIPRSTDDADFVLAIEARELDSLLSKLPTGFLIEPQARMELFTGTMRWILQVEGTTFTIELFILGCDVHHREMFRRKRHVHVPSLDRKAWLPSPEDLIIQKLRWARHRDLDDVLNVLAVQGDALDMAWIESWCARHGTSAKLGELRASLPPSV